MPDPRFFEDLGPVALAELASVAGAELSDPARGDIVVSGVAALAGARLSRCRREHVDVW